MYCRIGLQWPQGFSTKEHIECWFGDYDATNPKRPDNECRGETWPARYKGYFSRYNGSGNRNAVYRIGDIGVRYLGCWNSWPGSTEAGSFTSSIGTMEQCAERAVSNGHNRWGTLWQSYATKGNLVCPAMCFNTASHDACNTWST